MTAWRSSGGGGSSAVISTDISYATAIPLTSGSIAYMPQTVVSGAITFTVAASPVKNSSVYLRLVADGTNAPTFSGFKEWGGSLGYDNRANIVNEVQFFYDGYDYWYSISQAVGAVAIDVTSPTASSAAVANATPTVVNITMSETIDSGFVPAASAFTVSGHTVSSVAISGSTINLTVSSAFVNGESARTAAYTQPGTNNVRDSAGNLLANFTGLAITNNVAAAATGVTMTGPTSGTSGIASSNFTIGVTPVGGAITGTVVVTPADGGAGGTFTPTTRSLTAGSPTATFTYTAASEGVKTISVTNNGGLTNPSNITFTAGAAATVPGAPTIGTATAGDASASVTFTAPGSNGGSAITGYTVTSTPGSITASGSSSPINVTGLTNGTAYTFTVHATNAVGDSSESAASNSVTPSAGTQSNARLVNLSSAIEIAVDPYSYRGNSGTTGTGGVTSTALAVGGNGSLQVTLGNYGVNSTWELIMGPTTNTSPASFATMPYAIFSQFSTSQYIPITAGSLGTPTNVVAPANGDSVRVRRSGSTFVAEVSKNSGSTWTTIYTWTSVPTTGYRFQINLEGNIEANNLVGINLS